MDPPEAGAAGGGFRRAVSGEAAELAVLVGRLGAAEPGARRVAVLDLIRLADADPRATAALLEHVPRETDERAAILIVRHLGRARHRPAKALLKGLYDDARTPVRLAHAAILAHDAIELAGRADRDRGMDPPR